MNKQEEKENEGDGVKSSDRVAPNNPRPAVYGKGLEDVAEFFNSGNYEPGVKKSEEPRKVLSKQEKALLNKRKPDIAVATSSKWLPLHTLAASGEFYLMDALLKHNADINVVDKDGCSALHKAILGKNQVIMNYLLRESANPFVCDKDGWTPLHLAVQGRRTADKTLKNKDGLTPLGLCLYSGQDTRTDELIKLLKLLPKPH